MTSTGREVAQGFDQLGFIHDADKLLGLGCDDLLARECSATALDHESLAVDFVRAVDVDRQAFNGIGIENRDAQRLQALRANHGAGHHTLDLVLHGGQCINELVDRGASAHPTISPGTTYCSAA